MDDILKKHMDDDAKFQREQTRFNAEQTKFNAAITAKLETIATKNDVKEIKEFLKTVEVGVGFFKFSFNNASKIGSFLMLLFGLYILFRYGIVSAAMWVASKAHL